MGEVINNILKGLAWLLGILLVIAGIYTGIASLGADAATAFAADGATKYEALHNQVEARRWEAGVEDFYFHHWRWTWHMAVHPKLLRSAWAEAFPPIADIGQYVKGNWWNSHLVGITFTRRNLTYHFVGPIVGGLLAAVILEVIVLPLVRSRVAKGLATTNRKVFGKPKDIPRGDGFVLARGVRLARDGGGNPHVATFGPSGGKKSAAQAIRSVFQLPPDCGAVISDVKMEIAARCADYLRKQGHKIIIIGPKAGFGHGLDFLRRCKSPDDCRDLAQQIIEAGDDSIQATGNWNNMSQPLLSAYMIQAWSDGLGLADAFQLILDDQGSGEALTDNAAILDYRLFEGMKSSGGTSGSVWATIQAASKTWLQEMVVGWMSAENQFDYEDLRKGAVVFLVSSAGDTRKTRAIQRVFFAQIFDYLAASSGADVRIILDEFANLGKVQNIGEALNLLRSAGVGIHCFCQSLVQLYDVYSRDGGAVVFEAFGTICVMAGLKKDASEIANLLGEDEDVRPSYSTQDEKMRAQFSQQRRQAIDGAMLRQLRGKQVLIISGNCKPVIAKLKVWYSRFGFLRYRVYPRVLRRNWKDIPEDAKKAAFAHFPKIEPIQIVSKPRPKKEEQQEEKPKRKTLRIDLDDLADALAPHLQSHKPAVEGDGEPPVDHADPFVGLDMSLGQGKPQTDA